MIGQGLHRAARSTRSIYIVKSMLGNYGGRVKMKLGSFDLWFSIRLIPYISLDAYPPSQ